MVPFHSLGPLLILSHKWGLLGQLCSWPACATAISLIVCHLWCKYLFSLLRSFHTDDCFWFSHTSGSNFTKMVYNSCPACFDGVITASHSKRLVDEHVTKYHRECYKLWVFSHVKCLVMLSVFPFLCNSLTPWGWKMHLTDFFSLKWNQLKIL